MDTDAWIAVIQLQAKEPQGSQKEHENTTLLEAPQKHDLLTSRF